MANQAKGEITLRLNDGRQFVLVMDFDMRVAVEDLCEKPFAEVAQRAAAGFHGAVRSLMWGALQRHHSDLSMGDVTALIEEHGPEIEAAMGKAAEAATPPSVEGKKPGNRATRRATKTSGGSGVKSG